MFMGDNGALFTGYLIGALSVESTYYATASRPSGRS